MRMRGRGTGGRLATMARVNSGVSGTPVDGHTIVSITANGLGNVLMTTAAPHGLLGGETISITGNSNPAANTTWPSLEIPDTPTTIVIATPGDPNAVPVGTGGRWDLA